MNILLGEKIIEQLGEMEIKNKMKIKKITIDEEQNIEFLVDDEGVYELLYEVICRHCLDEDYFTFLKSENLNFYYIKSKVKFKQLKAMIKLLIIALYESERIIFTKQLENKIFLKLKKKSLAEINWIMILNYLVGGACLILALIVVPISLFINK